MVPRQEFKKSKIIKIKDDYYPERLRKIPYPPQTLYLKSGLKKKGLKELFSLPAIAVVGSRKMSSYGKVIAVRLVADFVKAGVVVVSGMARGIDAVAHRTAIKNKGKTIAVLGSGINLIYPSENKDIYEVLAKSKEGVVISEFAGKTLPEAKNFPVRNRIIAGLSDGVLVVEAAQKSGSLITASWAAEQGKDVFVIPGSINSPNSKGTAWLANQGAKLVCSAQEILEELK